MFIASSIVTSQLYAFYDQNSCLDDGDFVDIEGFLGIIHSSLKELQSHDFLIQPHAGAAVVNMIAAYNAYITYRGPAYQFLFPVVSFLQVFHAAMLSTPDTAFLCDLIKVQCAAMLSEEDI